MEACILINSTNEYLKLVFEIANIDFTICIRFGIQEARASILTRHFFHIRWERIYNTNPRAYLFKITVQDVCGIYFIILTTIGGIMPGKGLLIRVMTGENMLLVGNFIVSFYWIFAFSLANCDSTILILIIFD